MFSIIPGDDCCTFKKKLSGDVSKDIPPSLGEWQLYSTHWGPAKSPCSNYAGQRNIWLEQLHFFLWNPQLMEEIMGPGLVNEKEGWKQENSVYHDHCLPQVGGEGSQGRNQSYTAVLKQVQRPFSNLLTHHKHKIQSLFSTKRWGIKAGKNSLNVSHWFQSLPEEWAGSVCSDSETPTYSYQLYNFYCNIYFTW